MFYISHPKDKGTSAVPGCEQDPSANYSKDKRTCEKPQVDSAPGGFLGVSGGDEPGTGAVGVSGAGRSGLALHSIGPVCRSQR